MFRNDNLGLGTNLKSLVFFLFFLCRSLEAVLQINVHLLLALNSLALKTLKFAYQMLLGIVMVIIVIVIF